MLKAKSTARKTCHQSSGGARRKHKTCSLYTTKTINVEDDGSRLDSAFFAWCSLFLFRTISSHHHCGSPAIHINESDLTPPTCLFPLLPVSSLSFHVPHVMIPAGLVLHSCFIICLLTELWTPATSDDKLIMPYNLCTLTEVYFNIEPSMMLEKMFFLVAISNEWLNRSIIFV